MYALLLILFTITGLFGLSVKIIGGGGQPFNKTFSDNLKGYLSLMIICNHLAASIKNPIILEPMFRNIGFICVSIFFFISGWGTMYGYLKKEDYLNGFVSRKITKILIPYLIAIILYSAAEIATGSSFIECLESFAVGSPVAKYSWYIIAVFVYYIEFWIAFKQKKLNPWVVAWILHALNAFLKGKEKLYSSQITELKFREKAYGWRNQELYIKFENGRIYHAPIWVDNFYRLFTNNYILRDSCYSCKFSRMERQGDITIGDFWNIKNANETFEDKLGVSSVIINSEKGKKIFETVKNEFDIIECSLNDINQKNLNSPSPKPVHYEDFQRLIAEKGFEYCLKKYGSMKMLEKIRRALSPVKQRLKAMLRH